VRQRTDSLSLRLLSSLQWPCLAAAESDMLLSTLQRLGRSAFDTSSFLFGPAVEDTWVEPPVDLLSLEERLRATQALAKPGFMALHAVRKGAQIVDFEWDNASVAASRLLRGTATGLLGKRLVEVLAGRSGRGEIFSQYRRVVEFGAARAVQQRIEFNASVVVLRHAAVRLHDGVAVTLTNLSALRHEVALRREIQARSLMLSSAAHA